MQIKILFNTSNEIFNLENLLTFFRISESYFIFFHETNTKFKPSLIDREDSAETCNFGKLLKTPCNKLDFSRTVGIKS